jgi:serine phosphatase RsbU (regulator of sigma subunit)
MMRSARARPLVAAASGTLLVYGSVHWLERVIAGAVHPPHGEIRSVSDLILAAAFGVALYLWLDLRATRHALSAAERSQLVLNTQLALAAEVQHRLLPAAPGGGEVKWATRLQPAGKIGGDFYDFILTAGGSTLLVVGDVSGKGIPAALLQASAHALFRTFSRQASEPAELLHLVSREVFAENGGVLYLTCIAVLVDGAHRQITYVNAGHPPGLLLGPSRQRVLDKGGPPLGMFAETVYESDTLIIEPGELGIIVTDGITEAVGLDGGAVLPRLVTALARAGSPLTPQGVCDGLMALAARGSGPSNVSDWDDDKTVVAFEFEPDRALLPANVTSRAGEMQTADTRVR